MTNQTIATLLLAKRAANAGFAVKAIEIHTADGRPWSISVEGPRMGCQLFELDRESDRVEEHDPINGKYWKPGDMLDYLAAVAGSPEQRQPA